MATIDLLKDIYLFEDLTDGELNNIAELADVLEFEDNQKIFEQGSPAQALYVIKSGMVRIHQKSSSDDNIEVAVLGTGSHFGEMSWVDGATRSATATSIEKSILFVLKYQSLSDLVTSNQNIAVKLYHSFARFLCGRLRVTTNDLSFAREKNLRFF